MASAQVAQRFIKMDWNACARSAALPFPRPGHRLHEGAPLLGVQIEAGQHRFRVADELGEELLLDHRPPDQIPHARPAHVRPR